MRHINSFSVSILLLFFVLSFPSNKRNESNDSTHVSIFRNCNGKNVVTKERWYGTNDVALANRNHEHKKRWKWKKKLSAAEKNGFAVLWLFLLILVDFVFSTFPSWIARVNVNFTLAAGNAQVSLRLYKVIFIIPSAVIRANAENTWCLVCNRSNDDRWYRLVCVSSLLFSIGRQSFSRCS